MTGKDKNTMQGAFAQLANDNEFEAMNALRIIRAFAIKKAITPCDVFEQCFGGDPDELQRITDERDDYERQFKALDNAYGKMVSDVTILRRQAEEYRKASAGNVEETRQEFVEQLEEVEQKAARERERWAAAYGQVSHKLKAPSLNSMYHRLLICTALGVGMFDHFHTFGHYPIKPSLIWSVIPVVIVLMDFFVRKYLHEAKENEVIQAFIDQATITSANWEDRK